MLALLARFVPLISSSVKSVLNIESVNQHAHNSHKLPDLDLLSECYIHLSCDCPYACGENVGRHQIVLKNVQKNVQKRTKGLKTLKNEVKRR